MKRELAENIVRLCPLLFVDRYRDMRQTSMCWGFECGDGWYNLLKKTSLELETTIQDYVKKNPYPNEFPTWIFSRHNMHVSWKWRCYSFLAIWEWVLVGLGLRMPEPWWPRASQIKEKYGTLRFYLTSGTALMYTVTNEAERKSAKICEECGKPGKFRGDGWFYTSCKDHVRKD